jgi:hypothetical protein
VRASNEVRVVLAAGGLGTRVHHWARYRPKEFYPVGGRPGIAWILEEIAGLGAGHVVIVYHPYYRAFAEWAGQALSPSGETRYRRAAGRPIADRWTARGRRISFIAQHGRYGDLTSVLNGADHFPAAGDLYVAFADNLYFGRTRCSRSATCLLTRWPSSHAPASRNWRPGAASSRSLNATAGVWSPTSSRSPARARTLLSNDATALETCCSWRAGPGSLPTSSASPAHPRSHWAPSRGWP